MKAREISPEKGRGGEGYLLRSGMRTNGIIYEYYVPPCESVL